MNTNFMTRHKAIAVALMMLGSATLSVPVSAHQGGDPGGRCRGGNAVDMDQMPMMGHGPAGMMGGGGHMGMMGPMMGGGHKMKKFRRLGLNQEQEQKINDIQHELHKKHWAIMGQMIDRRADLRKAHAGDRPDPAAVGAVYGQIFDLRRQMIEADLEARNRSMDVLTGEQIARMKQSGRHGGGMMHGRGGKMQGQCGMMQGQGGMMDQPGQNN